jgi:hypothetical protein
MNKVTLFNKTYQIPANWDELAGKYLLKVAPLLFAPHESLETLYVDVLGAWLPKQKLAKLGNEEVYTLTELITWLSDEPQLTKNKLPALRSRWGMLYGPSASFGNICLGEYIVAEMAYLELMQKGHISKLDELVAVLYRYRKPILSKKGDDIRQPFDQKMNHLSAVRQLSSNAKFAILLYFASCKAEFSRLYPYLYQSAEPDSQENSWVDIIFEVTESRVFGTYDELTEKALIHNVLAFLDKKAKDYQEAQYRQNQLEKKYGKPTHH